MVEDDPLARLLRLAGPRDPVPVERSARARGHVEVAWRETLRRRSRRRWAMRAAMSLGGVLCAVLLWHAHRHDPVVAALERTTGSVWLTAREEASAASGSSRGAVRARTWVETGHDGRAALRMGDASLRVDVDTRVQILSASEVLLERGSLYADSGVSGRGGLVVRTAMAVASDVGTQFEVRTDGTTLRLRVREGRVDLTVAAWMHSAREGEELILAGGALRRGDVPVGGAPWEWTQLIAPAFTLEGHTLSELIAWYRRETHAAVDLSGIPADMQPARIVLHGQLPALSPQETLTAVLPTCGLRGNAIGNVLVLEPEVAAPDRKAVR